MSPAAPDFRGERKERGDLIVEFTSAVSGPAQPAGFEIRMAGGEWRSAAARLESGAVRLEGAAGCEAWRYAWAPFPGLEPLRGASGLPVVPCRRGDEPRRVGCIGDSITYGMTIENRDRDNYPAQLQGMLGGDWLVGNFGNSGRCVILTAMRGKTPRAWMKQREFARALAFEPDIVVSNLGINDVMAFDAAVFERDYGALIGAFAKERGAPEWRIGTPLGPLFPGHAYYGSEVIPRIDASLRKIAATHGFKTVDLRSALQDRGELFADHIHPNAEGATIIAREVAASLKR
jgi:lysophospholipase L1-like esterase